MLRRKIIILFSLVVGLFLNANAQLSESINDMDIAHKECLRIKSDSNNCSRKFLTQMDSMMNVVFNEVKNQISTKQKADLIKEQMSWNGKKGAFFKKQDENFVYNLQEGNWTKDMIRIVYEQKAEFILKRIRVLLKRLA